MYKWQIGDGIKVMVNEYKVMGMDMHVLTKDLGNTDSPQLKIGDVDMRNNVYIVEMQKPAPVY